MQMQLRKRRHPLWRRYLRLNNNQLKRFEALKPFVNIDLPRMFPGDQIKDIVFHQDCASRHTSKHMSKNINFVTPEEWMPKSPDAAPTDWLFGVS